MKSNLFKSFSTLCVAIVIATTSFWASAQNSFDKDTQQEVANLFLKPMEDSAKESIGTNGITDVQVFASENYAVSFFLIEGLSNLSEKDLLSLKQGMIKDYQNSGMVETFPILEETTGLKGFKFIYKDNKSFKSFTITIDFDEIVKSK